MLQSVRDLLAHDSFARETGVEITHVEPGKASARLLVGPKHLNGAGICQGGALFTLADTAFAAAANSHRHVTVSTCANMAFLRPAGEGWLYAEAVEAFSHERLPYYVVEIRNASGDLVAQMTSHGYCTRTPVPGAELKKE